MDAAESATRSGLYILFRVAERCGVDPWVAMHRPRWFQDLLVSYGWVRDREEAGAAKRLRERSER